ncbi:MAG: alpha/beta hydrolase family protein [Brevibacterium sp.]
MDFAPEPQPLHIPLATGAAQSPGAARSPGLPERLHASPGRRADSQIEGHLRLPESPRAVLTFHPATATPERFYSGFADFAAARGLAVVTYGYRGVGSSASARANRDVRMSDWMSEDVDAVAEWTAQRFPALPQVALGHSLGGHALALGHGTARLSGIVTIASHRAATRDISPLSERLRVHAILSLFGPGLSSLVGFAPGRRLGLGENIPTAAMRQWSRWSRMPDYFFDERSLGAAARMARMPVPGPRRRRHRRPVGLGRADRCPRRTPPQRRGDPPDLHPCRPRHGEGRPPWPHAAPRRQGRLARDRRLAPDGQRTNQ